MKRILISIILLSAYCMASQERPIVIVSIPKCGTHLVGEAISLFIDKKIYWPGYCRGKELDEALGSLGEDRFMMIHVPYRPEVVAIMESHNPILFFVYRDLRDQIISEAYFRQHWIDLGNGKRTTALEELITDLICNFVPPWAADSVTQKGIACQFEAMMPWTKHPGICVIRFEDLIGEKGGGSAAAQRETIARIAKHLGIAATEETIDYVVANIFGNGLTFREGKIGSWKDHFTPEHRELCKQLTGKILIELGYEKNLNW